MMLFVGLAAVAWAPHRPEAVAAAADVRVQASEDALTSLLLWPRRLQDDTPPPPSPQPPPPSPPRWPPPDLSQPFRPSFYALVIGSPLTIALVTAAWPHHTSYPVQCGGALCPLCARGARTRLLRLLRVPLAALGGSTLPGRSLVVPTAAVHRLVTQDSLQSCMSLACPHRRSWGGATLRPPLYPYP